MWWPATTSDGTFPSRGPEALRRRTGTFASRPGGVKLWKWVHTHDYSAGDFMWTGIDDLGETRWPGVGAGAGPIDIIGLPKAAYYFYQASGRKSRCCTSSRNGTGRGGKDS